MINMFSFFYIITKSVFLVIILPPLLYYIYYKRKSYPILYLIGVGITLLVVNFLKLVVAAERPEGMLIEETGYSFPSAHASLGFYLAGFVQNIKYRLPLIVYASLLSYSRVFLQVHFFRDIIAGSLIGLLIGYFIYKKKHVFYNKYEKVK